MIEQLFTSLSKAVEATPVIALFASVIWGVLSILLSPCHLASIPLIVGFIDGQGRVTTKRALVLSTLFAFGILITIALIGILTVSLGRMMGDVGAYGNYIVAAIFFVVGLYLFDIIPMPWSGMGQGNIKRKGLLAALLLGLLFGIALGPCTFAYMAPMLGVAFKLAAANLFRRVKLIAGLRCRTLFHYCSRRCQHYIGPKNSQLERVIKGSGHNEVYLWYFGHYSWSVSNMDSKIIWQRF